MAGVKPSTRRKYATVMRRYQFITGMTPTQMIDEAEENDLMSRRKQGAVEDRLKGFYKYLINDYVRKDHYGKNTNVIGIGDYSAVKNIGFIKSFYSANGFKCKWIPSKASPKKRNMRVELSPKI